MNITLTVVVAAIVILVAALVVITIFGSPFTSIPDTENEFNDILRDADNYATLGKESIFIDENFANETLNDDHYYLVDSAPACNSFNVYSEVWENNTIIWKPRIAGFTHVFVVSGGEVIDLKEITAEVFRNSAGSKTILLYLCKEVTK